MYLVPCTVYRVPCTLYRSASLAAIIEEERLARMGSIPIEDLTIVKQLKGLGDGADCRAVLGFTDRDFPDVQSFKFVGLVDETLHFICERWSAGVLVSGLFTVGPAKARAGVSKIRHQLRDAITKPWKKRRLDLASSFQAVSAGPLETATLIADVQQTADAAGMIGSNAHKIALEGVDLAYSAGRLGSAAYNLAEKGMELASSTGKLAQQADQRSGDNQMAISAIQQQLDSLKRGQEQSRAGIAATHAAFEKIPALLGSAVEAAVAPSMCRVPCGICMTSAAEKESTCCHFVACSDCWSRLRLQFWSNRCPGCRHQPLEILLFSRQRAAEILSTAREDERQTIIADTIRKASGVLQEPLQVAAAAGSASEAGADVVSTGSASAPEPVPERMNEPVPEATSSEPVPPEATSDSDENDSAASEEGWEEWSCPKCTYKNRKSYWTCKLCNEEGPRLLAAWGLRVA